LLPIELIYMIGGASRRGAVDDIVSLRLSGALNTSINPGSTSSAG
jgi:hypothetical protein